MANVSRYTGDTIAHLTGVKGAVKAEADEIAVRARARLAAHRDTGDSDIVVDSGRVDSFVRLEDEAGVSIEFGAFNKRAGHFVEGLYILTRAAGV